MHQTPSISCNVKSLLFICQNISVFVIFDRINSLSESNLGYKQVLFFPHSYIYFYIVLPAFIHNMVIMFKKKFSVFQTVSSSCFNLFPHIFDPCTVSVYFFIFSNLNCNLKQKVSPINS